jgi:hypothetical protein
MHPLDRLIAAQPGYRRAAGVGQHRDQRMPTPRTVARVGGLGQ